MSDHKCEFNWKSDASPRRCKHCGKTPYEELCALFTATKAARADAPEPEAPPSVN